MKRFFIRLFFIFLCSIFIESAYTQITYIDLNIEQPNSEDCVTGIETNFQSESITVFPNPTNGFFTISMDKADFNGEFVIIIHNITGQPVYSEKINVASEKLKKQINLSSYPSGIYLLSISSKKNYYKAEIILKQQAY